ncbi:MAG: hypothetical protein U0232_05950 [Thermomicrobiales bacterium]
MAIRASIAIALQSLGELALAADYPRARARYRESLALHRQLGLTRGTASVLHGLGVTERPRATLPRRRALLEESWGAVPGRGRRRGTAYPHPHHRRPGQHSPGRWRPARGGRHSARPTRAREEGTKRVVATCLDGFAGVAAAWPAARAARLHGAAWEARDRLGILMPPTDRARAERRLAAALHAPPKWPARPVEGRAPHFQRRPPS